MSMPELQPAELGGVEGSGYAFARSTYDGDAVSGVFFPLETPEEKLGQLVDLDAVTFSGVLYKRTRSGSMTQKKVELDVDVKRMSTVAFGDRLDFVEADEAE